MYIRSLAAPVLGIVVSCLLAGCDRHPIESASQSLPPTTSQSGPSAHVAVPSGDLSLPPAESALLRPKTGTDATGDTTLTRTERDTQMPLPGQANDHSSPEFAKRGDATAPAKSAK